MKTGGVSGIAHIVAVNMGYGHERPAHVLRPLAVNNEVIVANDYEGIPESDRKLWEGGRKIYEKISRFKRVPVLGGLVFGILDDLQKIPPFYPRRDLSSPNLQLRETYALIRHKNHMKHLIEKLAEDPRPLVCTFSPPAFAAEEFGYPDEIFCLATDADISRAWAPMDPKSSRIRYFAPNGRVVERLKLYGVQDKNIELTGFPLPMGLVGGTEATIALSDLKQRICNLDPNGIFISHTGQALTAYLGAGYCSAVKKSKSKAIEIAFAVGGAGAQREIGVTIAKSLMREIKQGKIVLHLVAGTRPEVAQYFEEELREMGLAGMIKKGQVNVLFEKDRQAYFDRFSALMRQIDILWTKPSELSFYTGLGIPIIMAPAVGSQEDYNRHWLQQIGGGVDQLDPRYTNEWLFDWIESGALARMAWNGFIEAPTHGTYRIADILLGRPNTIHDLPLVV
ncbi:MAG: hypothetical protein ABH826_02720 [Patescibacteria group bacterium]|nr:hypothetical protein [Patescibacteria group bacterium]